MYLSIKRGGLKIQNFKFQVSSLILAWIKRLLSPKTSKWKTLVHGFFEKIKLEDLLKTRTYMYEDTNVPQFYQELLHEWNKFQRLSSPDSPKDILKECIWYNDFIQVDTKSVFYQDWYVKGVLYVKDLFDEQGEPLSLDRFQEKFNLNINFLQYYGLLDALPRTWKQKIKNNYTNFTPTNQYKICIEGKLVPLKFVKSKDFYWEFQSRSNAIPTALQKWNNKYDISEVEWEEIFKLPYKCCMETKLQTFQFKINHRIITTNKRLCFMGIKESDKCNRCVDNIDTIEHRFYECNSSQRFWDSFQNWWSSLYNDIHLSEKDVIFGCINRPFPYILNFCILVAKYFIHVQLHRDQNIINFAAYLKVLQRKLQVIRTIMLKNDKMHIYDRNWSKIANSLENI